jgi:hypothetical protein
MRRDSLEKQLQTRPKPADLVREGILEGQLIADASFSERLTGQ